jgi:hypothetical protein
MSEDRDLRRIFEPNKGGITGGWRKLHNVKVHNLYSSPNIIRVNKSMSMIWAEHIAHAGVEKYIQHFTQEA